MSLFKVKKVTDLIKKEGNLL